MRKNRIEYIINEKKKACVVVMIIFIIVYSIIMRIILVNSIDNKMFSIVSIAITVMLILCLILVYVSFNRNIQKLKPLLNRRPVRCIIEGFAYEREIDSEGGSSYHVYPIVKNTEDNTLYLAFSDYALNRFNVRYTIIMNRIKNIQVCRKDGSEVQIGDEAYLYVKSRLHFMPKIDYEKHCALVDRTYLKMVDDQIDVSLFNNITYFEGVVDIEPGNE